MAPRLRVHVIRHHQPRRRQQHAAAARRRRRVAHEQLEGAEAFARRRLGGLDVPRQRLVEPVVLVLVLDLHRRAGRRGGGGRRRGGARRASPAPPPATSRPRSRPPSLAVVRPRALRRRRRRVGGGRRRHRRRRLAPHRAPAVRVVLAQLAHRAEVDEPLGVDVDARHAAAARARASPPPAGGSRATLRPPAATAALRSVISAVCRALLLVEATASPGMRWCTAPAGWTCSHLSSQRGPPCPACCRRATSKRRRRRRRARRPLRGSRTSTRIHPLVLLVGVRLEVSPLSARSQAPCSLVR